MILEYKNNLLDTVLINQKILIFKLRYQLINKVQREEWTKSVEEAKDYAQNEQKVEFVYPELK